MGWQKPQGRRPYAVLLENCSTEATKECVTNCNCKRGCFELAINGFMSTGEYTREDSITEIAVKITHWRSALLTCDSRSSALLDLLKGGRYKKWRSKGVPCDSAQTRWSRWKKNREMVGARGLNLGLRTRHCLPGCKENPFDLRAGQRSCRPAGRMRKGSRWREAGRWGRSAIGQG